MQKRNAQWVLPWLEKILPRPECVVPYPKNLKRTELAVPEFLEKNIRAMGGNRMDVLKATWRDVDFFRMENPIEIRKDMQPWVELHEKTSKRHPIRTKFNLAKQAMWRKLQPKINL